MKKYRFLVIMIVGLVLACGKDDGPASQPEPENRAPVASAGNDRQEEIGSTVTLDASGSTDADGDALTYKWTFAEKPQESDASITGALNAQAEFTLDRPGTYLVNLEVSDGELTTTAIVTVTNRAPELISISSLMDTPDLDDDTITQRGENMRVFGNYFSSFNMDNIVTLDGQPLEAKFEILDGDDGALESLLFTIPEEAVGGNLVLTVGPHSVTWPEPINILGLPISRTIEKNSGWRENERQQDPDGKTIEVGTKFRPLVNGEVIGFAIRLPRPDNVVVGASNRLTLWNANTREPIATSNVMYRLGDNSWKYVFLDQPVVLQKNMEYALSLNNTGNWYSYTDPNDPTGNRYPLIQENVELTTALIQSDVIVIGDEYPSRERNNLLMGSLDIIFIEDIQ